MTVKDLIEHLETKDPALEILVGLDPSERSDYFALTSNNRFLWIVQGQRASARARELTQPVESTLKSANLTASVKSN